MEGREGGEIDVADTFLLVIPRLQYVEKIRILAMQSIKYLHRYPLLMRIVLYCCTKITNIIDKEKIREQRWRRDVTGVAFSRPCFE